MALMLLDQSGQGLVRATSSFIRKNIESLFSDVEIVMPVEFVKQPIKVSEVEGKIYIEVHLWEAPDLV